MFDAIIFDMDGTLADSTRADYLAWKRLFAEFELPLSYEDYIPLLGIKSAVVAAKYLPLGNEERIKEALARKLVYFREIMEEEGVPAIPHANTFLESVRREPVKIALATSSREAKMRMVMDRLGFLPFFDAIVTGEEVANSKPHPDVFLLAARKLNVDPRKCLVFEDAVLGVQAAKNAGMTCIALEADHTRGMLGQADRVIPTFEGLSLEALYEEPA